MITQMSRKLSSFFVAHEIIPAEDSEVYEYSFEILISTIASFAALFVISALTGTISYTLLYLLGFVPLRLIAGGYHAKNHLRCFVILICTYSIFLVLLAFLPSEFLIYTVILAMIVSVVLVYLIAPSEDSNKPVSKDEGVRFKRKSRISILCYAVSIIIVAVLVSDIRFSLSLALGNLTVALSLLANLVKHEIGRIRINSMYTGKEVEEDEKT